MNNIIEIQIDSDDGEDIRALTRRLLYEAIAQGMKDRQANMSYSSNQNMGFINIYKSPPELTIKVIGSDQIVKELDDGTYQNKYGFEVLKYNDSPQVVEETVREGIFDIKDIN
jgi:hypothetical protein